MVIHYFSPDAFAGNDHKLALYLKTMCVCACFKLMLPLLLFEPGL
jgi:hypothetical protein